MSRHGENECAADVGVEIRRDDREKEVSMSMGSTMGEAKGSPASMMRDDDDRRGRYAG